MQILYSWARIYSTAQVMPMAGFANSLKPQPRDALEFTFKPQQHAVLQIKPNIHSTKLFRETPIFSIKINVALL
jgi:hypothetical protein